ncbi:uncharacterized protein FTOL_04867 [Fusarium torulosum]|uniref:Uncharacterized protein n=1 Tax=Fusarium torulosum TaxID=33205 RepID=A0AAE8SGT6_9HYPO|nr:uncharacterized protein FTOL_04867 [Fusarium torulosum]
MPFYPTFTGIRLDFAKTGVTYCRFWTVTRILPSAPHAHDPITMYYQAAERVVDT